MSPEKRSRVQEIFEAASQRSAEDRARFLKDACSDDAKLRAEVESLLLERDRVSEASEDSIEETDLLDDSIRPRDAGMSDSGEKERIASIGRYRVVSLLGEGGMGRVYEVEDTELQRKVALKVLPEAFAGDPK